MHIGFAGPTPLPSGKPCSIALVMNCFAAATASRTDFFCARPAVIAEAKIQPVPCVEGFVRRSL